DNNFPGKVTPPNLVKFIENDGPVKVATEIYESTVVKYESIIMMNRQKSATGAAVTIAILLNGKPVATIENGQELNLPSPNGSLTIVAMNTATGQKTQELVFEAASAVITFTTGFNASGIFLEKVKEEPF
ncbi:MAG: hypothetical protein FWG07_03910, partial [Treponema sp.]|nr:hypothetical protein [Treponema sp.]